MGKQPLEITPPNGQNDFDNLSVEYKLKLIAYQDEIFRAKKKLQESDVRMNDLQTKLDNYLRNKENQLAEIMFTAHTNAQRIENQARVQIQFYLDEMEIELQRKQREIELIEQKTSAFDQALITPSEPLVEADKSARLTVLEGSGGENEPTRKIEKLTVSPEENLPTAKKRLVSSKKAKPAKSVDKVELPTKVPKPKAEKNETINRLEEAAETIDAAEIATEIVAAPIDNANGEVLLEQLQKSDTDYSEPLSAAEIQPEEAIETESVSAAEIQQEKAEEPESGEVAMVEDELDEEPITKAAAPAAQAEANERMQLDAFIDVRYFTEESGSKQINHHALQVTIEVEVPADNYSVRYTKVSSDVVSTLMKYDNAILNDIYPFTFVAPNPNSIATYFFNLLDDMLAMMDLKLYSMTIVEFPDMCIKVDKRNTAFDNMLHKDKDMFEDIRKSLPACVESEPKDNSPLTGRLSKLLKREFK